MQSGRYLNKKLQAAIEAKKPLRWEFGDYDKYYTGMKLIAYTGYSETGRVYESVVFTTTSINGALEIEEALNARDIEATGWDEARKELERYRAKQRRPIL